MAGVQPTINVVQILSSLGRQILFVTQNNYFCSQSSIFSNAVFIELIQTPRLDKFSSLLFRSLKYFVRQINTVMYIVKNSKDVDMLIFGIGAEDHVLPIIIGYLLQKKIVLIFASSLSQVKGYGGSRLLPLFKVIEKTNVHLATKILVKSRSNIDNLNLTSVSKKVFICPDFYVDFSTFKCVEDLSNRNNIGYVGRFSREKGIINFIQAIPLIVSSNQNVHFLLIGNGNQSEYVNSFICENKLQKFVTVIPWVDHDLLPYYYNQMNLLVIPSYTETGPIVLFEAMACGTPVVSTSVGCVPDIISDGETGYILKFNSPEYIAKVVLDVLNKKDLDKISEKSMDKLRNQYSFEHVREIYRHLL